MAERRMFSKKIIDTDLFLDMPISTRLLYYDLSMRADDDGFVSSPKKIIRFVGCSDDDLKLLIAKQFIIPFESGICVIKDWKIHNYIQNDRYHPTNYLSEKSQLAVEENGTYTKCVQDVSTMDTEVRLGKVRLELGKDNTEMVTEIINYLNQKLSTNYRTTTKSTISLINARIKDKYILDDFKAVIDKKYKEWKGTEQEQYLTPDTLFGGKFEKYVNQKVGQVKSNSIKDNFEQREYPDEVLEKLYFNSD